MDANQSTASSQVRRRHHEGPRNHIISYAISIFLTILAFIAVVYQEAVDSSFLLIFLISLALVQAVVQLAFWMHMKDKGHLLIGVFFAFGALIGILAVIMGVYWVWW